MRKILEKEIDGVKIEIEKSRTGNKICIRITKDIVYHIAWFKTKEKADIYLYILYLHMFYNFRITDEEYFTIVKLIEK